MNRRSLVRASAALALVSLAALVSGCATGPKFADTSASMPALKPGEGRIFFCRSGSMFGAAVQPEIRLNDQVVGSSKPGGFFYVDRPAGSYVASASTETEGRASFTLDPGETKYLKTAPSFGIAVGRIVITIESPSTARGELASLSYTGTGR